MKHRYVKFPEEILLFEEQQDWRGAADFLYARWQKDRYDLNNLLCVALEIWYAFLECQYDREYCFRCNPKNDDEGQNDDILLDMLWETYDWGIKHFEENATFHAYMGYIIQYRPRYWYRDIRGCDYDEWQNKGCEMVKKAHESCPENVLFTAFYYEVLYFRENQDVFSEYKAAGKAIWESVTMEEWGTSSVPIHLRCLFDDDFKLYDDCESVKEYQPIDNGVIQDFLVTDVTISQSFVGIRGMKRTEKGASSKEERTTPVEQREHYLLNTENHQLFGPYDRKGFLEVCKDQQVQCPEDWVSTQEMDDWGAEKVLMEYWERRE